MIRIGTATAGVLGGLGVVAKTKAILLSMGALLTPFRLPVLMKIVSLFMCFFDCFSGCLFYCFLVIWELF